MPVRRHTQPRHYPGDAGAPGGLFTPVERPPTPPADFPLPRPSPSAVFKRVDEGGVLYSTADDVYFGVNGVGARIWELLPPVTRTFEELCEELAKVYSDVDLSRIRQDARRYIDELVASGLVQRPERERGLEGMGPERRGPRSD